MPQFWGNFGGPWSQTGVSGAQQQGVTFQLSAQLTITGLGWYRVDTASNWMPDRLLLWRVSDTAKLAELTTLNDAGTAGWQWTALPTPITLQSGVLYRVTSYSATGRTVAYISTNGPTTVPTPFEKPANVGVYGGTASFPDSSTGSYAWGADVTDDTSVQPGSGGGGPSPDPGEGTLHGIQQWLQFGYPTLRSDSLAKMIYDHLVGVGNVVQTISADTAGLLQWLSDEVVARLNTANTSLVNLLNRTSNIDGHIIGPSGGGGSAFYGPGGTQVADAAEQILAAVSVPPDLNLLREHLTLSPDLADDTRWTNTGHQVCVSDDFCDFGADAYVVQFTTIPAKHPQHLLPGGANWVPRLAWCAPLRNGLALPRQYLDFEQNLVTGGTTYMGGLLVYAGPGVEYVVDGLALDRGGP